MFIHEIIDALQRYEIRSQLLGDISVAQSKTGEWCKFEEIKERLIQFEKARNISFLDTSDNRQILLEATDQTINNVKQLIQNS
jgi:cell division FtsZ-interacting protein ZapD